MCEWIRETIERTPWEGHVFAVGGCCRDEYMGTEIKDLDLAVDLPDGGVKFARWLIRKHQTIGHPTFFLKYGTAKIRLRHFPEEEIELVQTRKEQYTKENARCPEIAYGTIEEDCFRRDFTANSLYYDITRRRTVDITGQGITDINNGVLRTPLDPDETFSDDPVRILRGLRFANRFGWTIDPPAYEAMLRHIDRMNLVSRERVHSEFCKMLNSPRPIAALQTLRETGALVAMVPEFEALTRNNTVWNRAMNRLEAMLAHYPDAPTRYRLACLMMELSGSAEEASKITRRVMTTLRFDRPIVSDVAFLVRFASIPESKLDNWRQIRALQNLASIPARMEFFCGFLIAIGRTDVAARLRAESHRLLSAGKGGFNKKSNRPAKGSADEAPAAKKPGRRRRCYRRRKKN